MLRFVFYILLLVISSSSFAQQGIQQHEAIRQDAEALFSKSSKIEMVSLKPYCSPTIIEEDTLYVDCIESSIILGKAGKGHTIDSTHIGTKYVLEKTEYDSLFSMLYVGKQSRIAAECYEPRHGITFYDASDSLIGYLEICFECNKIYGIEGTPIRGPLEEGKFKNLKLFFQSKGLVGQKE